MQAGRGQQVAWVLDCYMMMMTTIGTLFITYSLDDKFVHNFSLKTTKKNTICGV
jgi:hypothetical protein